LSVAWDEGLEWPGLPPLDRDRTADACVVGLGASGLTAVEELAGSMGSPWRITTVSSAAVYSCRTTPRPIPRVARSRCRHAAGARVTARVHLRMQCGQHAGHDRPRCDQCRSGDRRPRQPARDAGTAAGQPGSYSTAVDVGDGARPGAAAVSGLRPLGLRLRAAGRGRAAVRGRWARPICRRGVGRSRRCPQRPSRRGSRPWRREWRAARSG
jgi:hypothetical protein